MQISYFYTIIFGSILGLSIGLLFAFTHKIAWLKVVLLCLLWTVTFYFCRIEHLDISCVHTKFCYGKLQISLLFAIFGIVATFLTLVILGKLEPRKPSTQHRIEEK